jgi:hypothetical protein
MQDDILWQNKDTKLHENPLMGSSFKLFKATTGKRPTSKKSVKSTTFPHHDIHKHTRTSPDGVTHN